MASFTTLQPQRTRDQQKYVSTDLEACKQILVNGVEIRKKLIKIATKPYETFDSYKIKFKLTKMFKYFSSGREKEKFHFFISFNFNESIFNAAVRK